MSAVLHRYIHKSNIYILSLSSPDHQDEMLCLELCCFVCVIWPCQLSCLGSSVGRECRTSQVWVLLKAVWKWLSWWVALCCVIFLWESLGLIFSCMTFNYDLKKNMYIYISVVITILFLSATLWPRGNALLCRSVCSTVYKWWTVRWWMASADSTQCSLSCMGVSYTWCMHCCC